MPKHETDVERADFEIELPNELVDVTDEESDRIRQEIAGTAKEVRQTLTMNRAFLHPMPARKRKRKD